MEHLTCFTSKRLRMFRYESYLCITLLLQIKLYFIKNLVFTKYSLNLLVAF